jgi:quinol monooxygenase YgiN
MHEQVTWHVVLAVQPEDVQAFGALTAEMVEATRHEDGVLLYERYSRDGGRVIHVLERYANSEAAIAHLRAFIAQFGERFRTLVTREVFEVYGTPNDELKEILDRFGATYLAHFAGFGSHR